MLGEVCEIDGGEAGIDHGNNRVEESVNLLKDRNDAQVALSNERLVFVAEREVAQYAFVITNEVFFAVLLYLNVLHRAGALEGRDAAIDVRFTNPVDNEGCSIVIAHRGNNRDRVAFRKRVPGLQGEVCSNSSAEDFSGRQIVVDATVSNTDDVHFDRSSRTCDIS